MSYDDLCSFDETMSYVSIVVFTNLVGEDLLEKNIVSGM